jgi:N-methylhydantoinase B
VWKHDADGSEAEVPRVAAVELAPWERIVSVTNGGGGYGHPAERDPALVLDDVLEGWVTRERAESEYGIVLRPAGEDGQLEVDEEATRALRARLLG